MTATSKFSLGTFMDQLVGEFEALADLGLVLTRGQVRDLLPHLKQAREEAHLLEMEAERKGPRGRAGAIPLPELGTNVRLFPVIGRSPSRVISPRPVEDDACSAI